MDFIKSTTLHLLDVGADTLSFKRLVNDFKRFLHGGNLKLNRTKKFNVHFSDFIGFVLYRHNTRGMIAFEVHDIY